MRIDQAKALHLRDVLSAMGYEAKRESKGEWWYVSPFRHEADASFKISPDGKAWFDFGAGRGGNILDLIMQHQKTDVKGALRYLDGLSIRYESQPMTSAYSSSQDDLWNATQSRSEAHTEPLTDLGHNTNPSVQDDVLAVTKIQPLQNRALIQYLQRRGIDAEIARPWVKEIYYRHNEKPYFALAFENDSGAFEARNPYFKGIVGGSKDISTLKPAEGDFTSIAIFEGFMDFLSAIVVSEQPPTMPVIVLNSTAMQSRAVQTIQQMQVNTVHLYLDRDDTGRELANHFTEQLAPLTVMDKSILFDGYKDMNEWLVSRNSNISSSRAA